MYSSWIFGGVHTLQGYLKRMYLVLVLNFKDPILDIEMKRIKMDDTPDKSSNLW